MRLKREKYISNNPPTTTKPPQSHHTKTSSMDETSSNKSKNIYLNKILQKNFETQRITIEPSNVQKNYQNFQSSIQSILANEESRQKAKNYVLKMRNKQVSPNIKSEHHKKKTMVFSKTNYDGFYNIKQNRKLGDVLQENNNYKNNNFLEYNRYSNNNNNYINKNDQISPDKYIKVNKINRYFDEIPYSSDKDNIFVRSNLDMDRSNSRGVFNYNNISKINNNTHNFKNSNTSYPLNSNNRPINYQKKQYIENDENEYEEVFMNDNLENQIDSNSVSDNNSGLREVVIDNINEIYQSPETYNRRQEDYIDEGYKYSRRTELNNYNIYNTRSKSKNSYNNKLININNINPNEGLRKKTNKKTYTKLNLMKTSSKKSSDSANINKFNNNSLKIEKNRFRIRPKISITTV